MCVTTMYVLVRSIYNELAHVQDCAIGAFHSASNNLNGRLEHQNSKLPQELPGSARLPPWPSSRTPHKQVQQTGRSG